MRTATSARRAMTQLWLVLLASRSSVPTSATTVAALQIWVLSATDAATVALSWKEPLLPGTKPTF